MWQEMPAHLRWKLPGHLAVAGAVAGVCWRAVEPGLRRVFGHPYSDPELATAFVTRGRWQPPLDYAVQAAGGAAFAVCFVQFGGRRRRALFAAVLGENALLLAASPLVDRIHPDVRDGSWPPLTGNVRAYGVSVSGHLLYAALLAAALG
jgi:hypothetical protein